MKPLDKLRLEKAAVDCGFEMTPTERDGSMELRSARFPESVAIRAIGDDAFEVSVSSLLMLDAPEGISHLTVQGYDALYNSLKMAAAHARTLPNRVADEFRRETAGLPRTTETERLVVQRVGQNLFRAALLDYWRGRCCVTGLDVSELLRASHMKPWAKCTTDNERLDVFNGLLLAPHLDALFDGGWISFADDGTLLICATLSHAARLQLGLSVGWRLNGLKPEHAIYLGFHRLYNFRQT